MPVQANIPQVASFRRPRNDCVATFLSTAALHFVGERYSKSQLFQAFADRIDSNWRETGELPLVNEKGVFACFDSTIQDLKVGLRIGLTRFRDIPYEGYYDFADEQIRSGKFIGIGYRSRFVFGGTTDDLHMSAVERITVGHVYLQDAELESNSPVSWETIELATLSAESGFWTISKLIL